MKTKGVQPGTDSTKSGVQFPDPSLTGEGLESNGWVPSNSVVFRSV